MPRPKKNETLVKEEVKRQNLEIAAIAAVKMENDDYKYGKGAYRKFDEEGNPVWNKNELCRLAGVPGYCDNHVEKVVEHPYFLEMVALHRQRRLDPMFRAKLDDPTAQWRKIGKMALDNIYEQLEYAPHSVSLGDNLKIIKLVVDAGAAFDKGAQVDQRAQDLLSQMTPEQREKIVAGRKQRAIEQLKELDQLAAAHSGADHEDSRDS